jgi:putative tricarboxylic transport membrane protein
MMEFILPAIGHLFEPLNIFLMIIGLTGGIIVGALPGLTATMGVALMVPATFAMDATSGLIMLGAIYVGAIYGGSNSAVLICTPGTPSSVATTFDGWPLCKSGHADIGLYTSLMSSSFGGIVGTVMLLFLAAPLARFALQFGGPENFWLCIFGLSTIAVMSSGNMVKGLLGGALGLIVSTVGIDPNVGVPRFTFGYYPLVQGIEVIPAMIGLFSFSQVLYLVGSHKPFLADYVPTPGALKKVIHALTSRCKVILMRSSIIGGLVGMLPGAGGEIASIIAYNESKRWDKHPERYGTGVVEGLAASESANNAVIGGALIPMLTLGIPGSAVAAVILGALLAKGIQPGFKVFTATGDLAYTFIMSQFAVNLLMIPIGLVLARVMTKLLSIRLTFVAIGIVVLSVIGAYAIRNSMLDVWIVIAFGFIGYFSNLVGLDTGAMALGIILGPMIEENLGRCVHLSKASGGSVINVFFESPIAVLLMVLTALSLLTPLFLDWKRKRMEAKCACAPTSLKEGPPHA